MSEEVTLPVSRPISVLKPSALAAKFRVEGEGPSLWRVFYKKLLRWILIPVAILTVLLFIAGGIVYKVVDWQGLRDVFVQNIHQYTGLDVKVDGGMDFTFFPNFTITVKQVKVRNPDTSVDTTNIMAIPSMVLKYNYVDIFKGRQLVRQIQITDPIIYLRKFDNGKGNWVSSKANDNLGNVSDYAGWFEIINIENAQITYVSGEQGRPVRESFVLDKATLAADSIHGPFQITASSLGDLTQPAFNTKLQIGDLSEKKAPLEMNLTYGNHEVETKGTIENWQSDPTVNLAISAVFRPSNLEDFNAVQGAPEKDDQKILIGSQFTYKNHQIVFDKVDIRAPEIAANGSLHFGIGKENIYKTAYIQLNSASLNLDKYFMESRGGLIKEAVVKPLTMFKWIYNLLADRRVEYDIELNNLIIGGKTAKQLRLQSQKQGDNIQYLFRATGLPGDSSVTAESNMAPEGNDIEGVMEARGQDAYALLSWMDMTRYSMRPEGYKTFQFNANGAWLKNQLDLSKIKLSLGDVEAVGQIQFDIGESPKCKAAFRLSAIDLNQFIREKDADEEVAEASTADLLRNFDQFMDSFAVSLYLDKLLYRNYTLSNARGILRLKAGTVQIDGFSFASDFGNAQGDFTMNVKPMVPDITVRAAFDKLDLNILNTIFRDQQHAPVSITAAAETPESQRWSTQPEDFSALNSVNGMVALNVKQILYRNFVLDDNEVQLNLHNGQVNTNIVSNKMFDSKVEIKALVSARPFYSNITFTTSDVDVRPLLRSFFSIESIDGRSGLSGSLSFFGNSELEWIKSLQGSINIVARNMTIRGFDLVLLSRKIPTLQDVREVRFWGHKALNSGLTKFDYFSNMVKIEGGVFTVNSAQLSSDILANDVFTISLNAVEDKINVKGEMTVKTADGKNIPVKIAMDSPMDNIMPVWNQQGIEDYWASRFYQR